MTIQERNILFVQLFDFSCSIGMYMLIIIFIDPIFYDEKTPCLTDPRNRKFWHPLIWQFCFITPLVISKNGILLFHLYQLNDYVFQYDKLS